MDEAVATRLLASIEMDRLVVLCGAGLSRSSPSNLPLAKDLANICYRKYERHTGYRLPDHMENNLEEIARYFWERNEFKTTFIQMLIPWEELYQNPNVGHLAIADFLACGVTEFTLSTNIDYLIETAAAALGKLDFQNSIGSDDIDSAYIKHKPLIKIHGCCQKDRINTVWCSEQIRIDPIQGRINRISQWLTGRLESKDILIIGFWSDWAYLNSILESCISNIAPNSVFLVDPLSDSQLEERAPGLWAWAKNQNSTFFHIQESGDTFLNQLRKIYSIQFLKDVLCRAKPSYQNRFGSQFSASINIGDDIEVSALYDIRRDVSGTPTNKSVRCKRTDESFELIGLFHLRLISLGATFEPPFFKFRGKLIRLINSSGKMLSSVKNIYSHEPISQTAPDINVCVGAGTDYSPADIVNGDQEANIVRPGLSGKWITEKELPNELGLSE